MDEQRLLFDVPVKAHTSRADRSGLVHRHDPRTSHEAARKLEESGKLTGQRRQVLEALGRCNGVTHAVLGRFMGLHWLTPARRLPELERAGLVTKGEARICRVKGSKCVTWWTAEANRERHDGQR
jgi:hypothetical protein